MAKKSWMIVLLAASSMAALAAGGDETRPAAAPLAPVPPAAVAPAAVAPAPVPPAPVPPAPVPPAPVPPATAPLAPVPPAAVPPATAPPLRPMPEHYNVLLTRSIFSKDSRPAPAAHSTAKVSDSPSASAPEADYVLRGVGVADGQPTAFFELTSEHKIVLVHLGDPLLHGNISAGSLDGVDYVVGGKASHIIIGQSLDGGIAVTAPTAAVSSAPAPEITPAQKKWIKKHHQE